jgi:cytochrome c553
MAGDRNFPATLKQPQSMKAKTIATLGAVAVSLLVTASLSARAADISETWNQKCAACHGKDGKGQTRMGKKLGVKDYTDAKVQSDLTDDIAIKTIKEGFKDDKGTQQMKPFADTLSDDDIKALLGYIRNFKKP